MKWHVTIVCFVFVPFFMIACSKGKTSNPAAPPTVVVPFLMLGAQVNGSAVADGSVSYNISTAPLFAFRFTAPVSRATPSAVSLTESTGSVIPASISFANGDSTLLLQPASPLKNIARYSIKISGQLSSTGGSFLPASFSAGFVTAIDSADKFARVSDSALLDIVQRQTFAYFWDFGHPVSGLARERNTSGDLVTSGGSGFGIMALVTGIHRKFITRAQGLARMQKMVGFLKNTAQKFKGAFPHWLNGNTGAVIPFGADDDGADLVETAFLMQGLLTARQYFAGSDAAETQLRGDINVIWNGIEWDWFRKSNENVLYWHWSPNVGFAKNLQVKGWNESLMVYVLAASSAMYTIPKIVYDNGWAGNGSMRNGNIYYNNLLPLGPALGGPLFFEHYSFLGINPNGLTDAYANYQTQAENHTRINYEYCKANPKGYFGYSSQCWGLTASDVEGGYTASSPTNDVGVIAPTAALSSMPYTPEESMNALRFFYYKLGDKILKEYGFIDAFKLHDPWFASSFLAIDQGPIIVMIENYRSGLLWSLFTSCPEVKAGMKKLGFSAPYL